MFPRGGGLDFGDGNKLENLIRKGKAILGAGEYEDATTSERVQGALGFHDHGVFDKQKEKERIGLEAGDIVGVSRGIYEHYGVYVGNKKVVHYTADDSDLGGRISETDFSRFLRDAKEYFPLVFPDKYGEPGKSFFSDVNFGLGLVANQSLYREIILWYKKSKYTLYSNTETISRARSRLGETKYNLIVNNCEHFAVWCKTGISESHQVNKILKALKPKNPILYHSSQL